MPLILLPPTSGKGRVRPWKMLSSWLGAWQTSANQWLPGALTRHAAGSGVLRSSSSPLCSARSGSGSSRCSARYVMGSPRSPSRRCSPDFLSQTLASHRDCDGEGSIQQSCGILWTVPFGIAAAGLPLANGTSGYAQQFGQARSRQAAAIGSNWEETCHLLAADFPRHSRYTGRGVGCARGGGFQAAERFLHGKQVMTEAGTPATDAEWAAPAATAWTRGDAAHGALAQPRQ